MAIHPAKPSGRRRGDRTIMNHSLTAYRAIILRRISPLLQSLSPSLSPPPPLEARHSSCKWAKKAARGYLLPHRDFERASEREEPIQRRAGGLTATGLQARAKEMSPCLNLLPWILPDKLTCLPERKISKLISLNSASFLLLNHVQGAVS